jgi:SAM-dependent methyltransferase
MEGFRRPRAHPLETANETAEDYLIDLGLTWSELAGKKVLDIGAWSGEFESAAREHDVDVISLDRALESIDATPTENQLVVALATKLPFSSETFDCAVAHMSVFNYREDGYKEEEYLLYAEDSLREACRVLKKGGEFRFLDLSLEASEIQKDDNDIAPEEGTEAFDIWYATRQCEFLTEIATRAGFSNLQAIPYSSLEKEHQKKVGFVNMRHYLIATK